MKNIEHKKLWRTLKELRDQSHYLQNLTVDLKLAISELEHTEERLELVKKRRGCAEFLTNLNREIRNVKLAVRECQRNFG